MILVWIPVYKEHVDNELADDLGSTELTLNASELTNDLGFLLIFNVALIAILFGPIENCISYGVKLLVIAIALRGP